MVICLLVTDLLEVFLIKVTLKSNFVATIFLQAIILLFYFIYNVLC